MVNAVKKNKIRFQTGSMQRSSGINSAMLLILYAMVISAQVKEVLVNVGDPAVPDDLPGMPVPDVLNWDGWVGPGEDESFNPELAPPVEKDIYPNWRNYKEYGGGLLSDWGAHMFDIAQWGLDMDSSGPVKFIPPTDPNAKRGLTMVYANGVVMKHEDFGRNYAVRFIGDKGTLDVSRIFSTAIPVILQQQHWAMMRKEFTTATTIIKIFSTVSNPAKNRSAMWKRAPQQQCLRIGQYCLLDEPPIGMGSEKRTV
jgi:hypothetical protein